MKMKHVDAIQLTFKYHVKVVIPLLTMCFDQWNLIANAFAIVVIDAVKVNLEENVFNMKASIEEFFEQ